MSELSRFRANMSELSRLRANMSELSRLRANMSELSRLRVNMSAFLLFNSEFVTKNQHDLPVRFFCQQILVLFKGQNHYRQMLILIMPFCE